MSMKDGGPAFPGETESVGQRVGHRGMSLLDWFAGQALSGFCAHGKWDYSAGPCNAAIVERAWYIAGLMLAERERREGRT
jgi:hypothetical protein